MANDDNELKAAADRIAALQSSNEGPDTFEAQKLPQARHYLTAAKWGFDQMVKQRRVGAGYVFHIIGVLTLLRAVPFALNRRDRKISPAHEAVIGDWWARTHLTTTPLLLFLKRARDTALKEGGLDSIAVKSESRIGEGPNAIVTSREYTVDLVDGDERHDLLAKLFEIFDWFEIQLSQIEGQLPEPSSTTVG
jgi:hypothetical protein